MPAGDIVSDTSMKALLRLYYGSVKALPAGEIGSDRSLATPPDPAGLPGALCDFTAV